VYRFRLISEGGEDLGPFVSREPSWDPGRHVQRNSGDALIVTAVVPAEDGAEFAAYLVVERAPQAA
jgi:hypothetical protein